MSEEFCTDYKDGDIVWVKLGPSWWPGEVKDLNNIPSEEIEFKKPPLVVVQFFEEDTYEYVRSWSNIYPFNSEKKVDFIKKGMAAFHSKASHMEKFPKDVVTAEVKIGGNSNILSDPAYRVEVKRNYPADNTTSPNTKKRSKESKKGKNQIQRDTSHITHRRFLGCDDYKAYICIQYPGKDRTAGDSEDEEIIRINTEPEQEYNCHSCSYSTKRLEVMILHTKSHIQGHYVSSPKRKRPVVPKARKKESPKKQRPPTLSWSHDSSSDEISEPPKEKKRKTKLVSSNKAAAEIAEVKPKKASDICNDLLAEWDDTDDEVGLENTFDVTATSENDDTKSETNEVLKNGEDNMDKVDTDVTENEDKDACAEVTEEDAKSKETSKPTMDQDTQEAIKSCFDFEEDEEEEMISTPVVEGRKIPRVIPPTEKRKSEILEDIIDLEEGINKEEILKVSQSFNERKSENIELENVFKDFMDEVAVPKLPEVKTNLKPTQNFHCVKTIKFPDKLDEPPQKDRDKNEAKLINPKKRFVKSFEDFENQLHKEEIKRKEEDELNRKKVKENLFKVKQIDEYDDSDLIKVDIGRLQCTIMSKIIDEINISDESKQNIMSRLHKKKSPRGKILDSYLSDSASTSQSEYVDPKQVTEDISLPGTSKESTKAKTKQSDEGETDSSSIKNKEDRQSTFLESTNESIDTNKMKSNKKLRKRSFNVEEKEETVTKDDQSKFRKTRHPSSETCRLSTDVIEDKSEANTDHACFDRHKSTTEQTIRKLSFRLSLSEPYLNEKQDDEKISAPTDVNDEKEDKNEKTTRSSRRKFLGEKTLETDERTEVESKTDKNQKTAKRTTQDQITRENLNDELKNDETKEKSTDDNNGSITERHYESETAVVESLSEDVEAKHDKTEDIECKGSSLLGMDSSSEVEVKDNKEVKTGVSPDEIKEILTEDEDKTEHIVVGDGSEYVKDEGDAVEQTTERIMRKRTGRKSAIEEKIDKNEQITDDITNDPKSLFEIIDDKDEDKTEHKRSSRHSSSGKHRTLSAKVTARKSSRKSSSETHQVQEKYSHDEIKEKAVPLQSSTDSKIEQLSSDGDVTRKDDEIPEKTVRKRSSRHFFTGKHRVLKTDDYSDEILTKDITESGKLEEVTCQNIEQATDRTTRSRSSRQFPSEKNRVLETDDEIKEIAVTSSNKNEENEEHLTDDKVDETTDKALRRRSSRHSLPVKIDPVVQASEDEYLPDEMVKHDQTKDGEDTVDKNERKRSSCQSSSETKIERSTDDKVDETTDKSLRRRSSRHLLPVKVDPVLQTSVADEMVKHKQTNDDEDNVNRKRSTRHSSGKHRTLKTKVDDEIKNTDVKVTENLHAEIAITDEVSEKELTTDKTGYKISCKSSSDKIEESAAPEIANESNSSQSPSETKMEHLPVDSQINMVKDEEIAYKTVHRRSSRHSSSDKYHEFKKIATDNLPVDEIDQKRSSRYCASKSEHLPDKIEVVVAKDDENVQEQTFSSDIDVITTKEEDKTVHKRSSRHSSSGKHHISKPITDNFFSDEVRGVVVEIEQIYCLTETPQASTSISDEIVAKDDKNDHIDLITTKNEDITLHKPSSRHCSSAKVDDSHKIQDYDNKNLGDGIEVSTVDKNEEHVEKAGQEQSFSESTLKVNEDVLDKVEKVAYDRCEETTTITEDNLDKDKDKIAISDEITNDDKKERTVMTLEDNSSKKALHKGKFRILSLKEQEPLDNKVEDHQHKIIEDISQSAENKVNEERQEASQHSSKQEQKGIQIVEQLQKTDETPETVDKVSSDQTIVQYSLMQSSSGIETIEKQSVQTNDELPKQEFQIDRKKEEVSVEKVDEKSLESTEPNFNTKPQTITTLLKEPQATDKELMGHKSDVAATLENRQTLRLPFKKGRWSIRTSHPKKYRNIETLSSFGIAEADKIKTTTTNESPTKPTVKDNVEILPEEINLDKNKTGDESLVSQTDTATVEKISSLESIPITENEVKLTENVNEVTVEDVKSLSEEKPTEQDKSSSKDIETKVDEDNFDHSDLNLKLSELCSQNEEFSVENTSLELPEYAICEPSTKFNKRKRSRRLPKLCYKKKRKQSEDLTDEDNTEQFDEETNAKEEIEDENVPIIVNQEVVNDSTIETVEEETIFEVTIEEDSVHIEEKFDEVIGDKKAENTIVADETIETCIEAEESSKSESIIGEAVVINEEVVIEEPVLAKEQITVEETVPQKDQVSSTEETVLFDPTPTCSFGCNQDLVENKQNDFGEYRNLLEKKDIDSNEDKQSIESKFNDMPADDEDEKLTDLVSDIVQKLNRDESDKNQEVLDMELEEEMRLSPKSPRIKLKEANLEPSIEEKTKSEVIEKDKNSDEKIPNEVEIFCASNSNDSFKFCIQTNLSNLSRSEEISAIALATLSEVQTENQSSTTEEIAPKVDLPSPEKLSDTEMAAIEGNLTVMSEKDLADAQVEITSEKVISCKKPVMLSSFSMDFSESNETTTEPRKYKDIDSKGTEFTSRAITKEFKPKTHTKKMNTYNQCELLNILEGNSDADKKIVEFQTPAKSFTGDICDFEEHIPSQIVCTKQFKQDLDDEFKKKDKSAVISTTSKLLERLTEMKTDTKKETPTETATKTIKPKPKLKPIILSEQIIKPASDPKKIIPLSSNVVNDIEDVEAFIIRKDIKKHVEVEETVPAIKHARKPRQKPLGKANILQQTIITPAGEIIQPATTATLPKMKTVLVNAPAATISTRTPAENASLIELNKTSKSTVTAAVNAEGTNQDDNVFDIFNMPIVLSDQILTPESIENMPIVIENNAPINKPKPIAPPTKVMPSKVLTKIVTTGKTTVISTKGTNVSAKFSKPKILQTTTKSVTPNILSRSTKPGKYILVSQSSGISQHPKKTIIKKTSLPASLPTKLTGSSEGAGHKIMVVTNQQGQQQRLLLTPAQQKVLGYQPSIGSKVEKPVIKTDILQKSLTTAALKPEIGGIKSSTTQKIVTTAGQVIAGVTTSRSIKPVLKRSPSSPSSQKLTSAKTTKTILITNKHGQTIKKIATTEDDIDKQVAEQLEAIKASSGMHFSSQSKSEPIANKLLQKSPAPKKYNRKQESKFKTIPVSTKSEIPPNPILPLASPKKIITQVPETKKVIQEEPKPQIDRPLNQLVIQDALGNQTTITEGQILALPSETVDGQPQSYMLVTLDQAGNLTPLNNEALMSLDPNLGLGGDLSNIVLQIDQGALGTGNINQPTPLAQPATVKITNPGEELQAGTSKIEIPRETVPLSLPVANEVPIVEQKIEDNIMVAPTEASVNIVSNSNGDQGQQLIVTGDPIATQKFLESLSEGTTDLANIIANAEGKSILIQADGQQILINTNTDSQMLTNVVESTEGDGNPVFATQPSKNTDILAAALADTDVFSTQTKVSSQLSPNNALYPINVSNVLETSLTLNSPIMTPLEVPSSNSKKIPDDVVDILTQVPKNVDLPITITDPNISQTVANQQVATLIGNEFQANLELGLSIPEATITAVSTGLSSPGYNYSLSTLDDNDMTHKPFNSSMPLLNDDVEDGITVKKSDKDDDKNMSAGSFLGEESRFTLGGGMCSSLSEPPPEMFDIPDNAYGEKNGNNIPLSLQSTPDPKDDDGSIQTESSSEGSCEIPLQPKIVAKSADLSEVNDI